MTETEFNLRARLAAMRRVLELTKYCTEARAKAIQLVEFALYRIELSKGS